MMPFTPATSSSRFLLACVCLLLHQMTEPVDDLATDLLQGCYPLEGACWEAAAKHPDVKVLNGAVATLPCLFKEGM